MVKQYIQESDNHERSIQPIKIGRFDQIKLITTSNVEYLSAKPGTKISPDGIWSVIAILEEKDLLCARRSVIIRIPAKDVLKIAGYDVSKVTKNFGKLSSVEDRRSTSKAEEIDGEEIRTNGGSG